MLLDSGRGGSRGRLSREVTSDECGGFMQSQPSEERETPATPRTPSETGKGDQQSQSGELSRTWAKKTFHTMKELGFYLKGNRS